ncbi:hypothetical protein ACFSNO_19445 [Streptomyces cirratus]
MIPKRFRPAAIAALTVALASGSMLAYSANAGTGPEAADRATADTFAAVADDVLSQRTQAWSMNSQVTTIRGTSPRRRGCRPS